MPHELLRFVSLPSTNSYLRELLVEGGSLCSPTTVVAQAQPQGRGQQGNTWYTPDGQNLTLTTYLRPHTLHPSEQFAVSELAALSAFDTVSPYLPQPEALRIKWPNDLYYQDNKLGGILIEHSITASLIDHSLIGIGINVNEESFPNSLPNPVSVRQIVGYELPIEELLKRYCALIDSSLPLLDTPDGRDQLHRSYVARLYRRDGYHLYTSQGRTFRARIEDVLPSGLISLVDEGGVRTTYAFKQLQFVL
ncbi:MAG: biotin--[acetyl-CoA-carboxylase] ligase [Porphyromonas sp.]|nr:biotin--[acetyl-CoA-carboxylase] ligase [Porphyromonas sp.]